MQTINDRLGQLAVQLRDTIDEVDREAANIAGMTLAQLQAYGFSGDANSGDCQVLQGFGASGQNLKSAVYGNIANAQGSNLMFWILKLVGND